MAEFSIQPTPLQMDSEQQPITGAYLKNAKDLQVGSGDKQFKISEQGIHLGAERFADAPFSVDMEGNGKFTGEVVISSGSGIGNLTDAGALATADTVEASNLGTTVISGGKIITGLLTADNIKAGTLTGRTVIANGGTGSDVRMQNDGTLTFWQWGSLQSTFYSDGSGNLFIDTSKILYLNATNNFVAFCDRQDIMFNDDNDGSDAHWYSNGNLKMQLTSGGELRVEDNVVPNAGIDFAELFESKDGKRIPFGTSVVLDGGKIRPAEDGETPFGIISSTPAILCTGGEADNGTAWPGKYLKDEWEKPILEEAEWWSTDNYEDLGNGKKARRGRKGNYSDIEKAPKGAKKKKVLRKKINPEWNPNKTYTPRRERPEWNVVGLIGQIRMLKGQPVDPRWIKIRDINDTIELWLVR